MHVQGNVGLQADLTKTELLEQQYFLWGSTCISAWPYWVLVYLQIQMIVLVIRHLMSRLICKLS